VNLNSLSPFLNKKIILENKHSFSIMDGFPVSKGHSLVIPKREVFSIFELNKEEYLDCFLLLKLLREKLHTDFSCDGFNIGINNGEVAGQTVSHAHIHIIPRYKGDIKSPRGGVRNIIPNNSNY
jgi:diadenosine tetraphosphate (Ap4A) HIT family hydrolase